MIGDGEGAPGDVIRLQFTVAGTLCQIVHRSGQPQQREFVCVLDHRHDKSFLAQRNRHADVDLAVHDHSLVAPGSVDDGIGLQRLSGGVHEIRREGQAHPGLGKGFFVRFAMGHNTAQVGLEHGEHMGRRVLGVHHMLGDGLADAVQGHDGIARQRGHRPGFEARRPARGHRDHRRSHLACRRGCRCRCRSGLPLGQIGQHILLGDAPPQPGSSHLTQVHPVLIGQFGHQRRDEPQLRMPPGLVMHLHARPRRSCLRSRSGGLRCRGHRGSLGNGPRLWGPGLHLRGRRRGLGFWRFFFGDGFPRFADPGQQTTHRNYRAFRRQNLQHHPVGRGGNLGIHLIGAHFHQRLVFLYCIAFSLQPAIHRAFDDAFT